MKQILQNLKTGETEVAEIPCPSVQRGQLLIHTTQTLVSAGTERMLVEFGKANFIDKARQQPDKVKMVFDKIKTDGLLPTVEAVRNKLDQPLSMGYCNVGVLLDIGKGVTGFTVGDRIASNGKHAEVVSVPVNLCAKIPDNVTDEQAAFTVIAAIALQGIRLIQPTLGETVVVTGLGLIGQMAVQLLRAQGCRVLGIDFDPEKLALAKSFGAEVVNPAKGEDPIVIAQAFSRGRGVDAVLVTASTASSEPMHQAALMCRQRGRIVLVGVTGLELSRADFYEKELTFQVSCSYGPGRYDQNYEEKGLDYPVGFVRWTEQRNFEAVLDMMSSGLLNVGSLISHRFAIEQADEAYQLVGGAGKSLGILLQYPQNKPLAEVRQQTVKISTQPSSAVQSAIVAFVGSGNYATAVLIPAFKETNARLKTVASNGGVSGLHAGRKHGFDETTTATNDIFADSEINTVVITTRHDSHATLVCQALEKGKHIFVEKPLALDHHGINEVVAAYQRVEQAGQAPLVMVGFNRRFSPQVQKMKSLLASSSEPKVLIMTVNAGDIPVDHWTQDAQVGGGRIIGEGCHFVDLLRFLVGAPIQDFQAASLGRVAGVAISEDKATITLRFVDGSLGMIHYLANGHKGYPKERLEVFCGGKILQLDNFRKLVGFGWTGFSKMNLWTQDKGQKACAAAFIAAITEGKPSPIPFDEIIEVSRVTIDIAQSLRS